MSIEEMTEEFGNKLFCDLKNDTEKANFFLSGRGHETGVVAHAIQNDIAMAYQRCAASTVELRCLNAVNQELLQVVVDALEIFEFGNDDKTVVVPNWVARARAAKAKAEGKNT